MQKYLNAIQDVYGNAVAGAAVEVYIYGTATKATIYSDNGVTPIPGSVVNTDSVGEFYFYAANGRYSLTVTATNFTTDAYSDILLFDPTEPDSVSSADVSFLPSGSGAVLRTAQDKLREIVSVKDFGAIGDGSANDTLAIQTAISASYGKTLFFPSGTYLSSDLTCIGDISFTGEPGSILKYRAGGVSALVTISGTSHFFSSYGMTYDANGVNQSGSTFTIKFTSPGTSTAPASFIATNNTFLNGDYGDISIATDTSLATIETVLIEGNRFLGGKEGTSTLDSRYIHFSGGVNLCVQNNYFDLLATPTTNGRAGIVFFVSGYTGTGSRGSISNNTMVNVGRSTTSATNGVLGAIDGYYGANTIAINGNTLINPYGRGIQIKTNAYNVAINGNAINGLGDLTAGTSVDSQITVNRSTTTASGGSWIISNNTLVDSGWDGISVSCANNDFSAYASPVIVANNIVTNATRRGIGFYYANGAVITSNVINNGCTSAGIYISNTQSGFVSVNNNTSKNITGTYDLLIATMGSSCPIDVSDNRFLSAVPYVVSGTDYGMVRFSNNTTAVSNRINTYSLINDWLSTQLDWVTGSPNATVNQSLILAVGSYEAVFEGDCTAGAGGLSLFMGSAGGLTFSYFRGTGQLYNGTTMVDSRQLTGTSGSGTGSLVAYSGVCTHYRVIFSFTLSAAGSILLRGNQNVANAATSSIYAGATMKLTRIS